MYTLCNMLHNFFIKFTNESHRLNAFVDSILAPLAGTKFNNNTYFNNTNP